MIFFGTLDFGVGGSNSGLCLCDDGLLQVAGGYQVSERGLLRGPSPEEGEELRQAGGWDPMVARKIATERAAAEPFTLVTPSSGARCEVNVTSYADHELKREK